MQQEACVCCLVPRKMRSLQAIGLTTRDRCNKSLVCAMSAGSRNADVARARYKRCGHVNVLGNFFPRVLSHFLHSFQGRVLFEIFYLRLLISSIFYSFFALESRMYIMYRFSLDISRRERVDGRWKRLFFVEKKKIISLLADFKLWLLLSTSEINS